MRREGYHMQITLISISDLVPAHSYIVLGGEEALLQVLNGKVALGRHRDERYRASWCICCFLGRGHLSEDHYQTFVPTPLALRSTPA